MGFIIATSQILFSKNINNYSTYVSNSRSYVIGNISKTNRATINITLGINSTPIYLYVFNKYNIIQPNNTLHDFKEYLNRTDATPILSTQVNKTFIKTIDIPPGLIEIAIFGLYPNFSRVIVTIYDELDTFVISVGYGVSAISVALLIIVRKYEEIEV